MIRATSKQSIAAWRFSQCVKNMAARGGDHDTRAEDHAHLLVSPHALNRGPFQHVLLMQLV